MPKNKLAKFAEVNTFSNVIQPDFNEVFKKDFYLKGKWNTDFFKNNNPLILELGCGKGEYTTGLARKYPNKNFIGIDIKGSRIWRGAKSAGEERLLNVCFLRTRIELINSFFTKNEVEEIWITFPDPQPKKSKKRLTSSQFLNLYKSFLNDRGNVHLKTDNKMLYDYTLNLVQYNKLKILTSAIDLYKSETNNEILTIQTYYERKFLEKGLNIYYLNFRLGDDKNIEERLEERG